MLKIGGIIFIAIVMLLCGNFLFSWYDLHFGEGAKERERSYQKWQKNHDQEKALKAAIWTNCSDVIRSKADVATLQINWDSPSGESQTEQGWRADLRASDSTGSVQVTCYTDNAGRVIRMITR